MEPKATKTILYLLIAIALASAFALRYHHLYQVLDCGSKEAAAATLSVMVDGKVFKPGDESVLECNKVHIYCITLNALSGCKSLQVNLPQITCGDSTFLSKPYTVTCTDPRTTDQPTRIIYTGNPQQKVNKVTLSFRNIFAAFLNHGAITIQGCNYCGDTVNLAMPVSYTGQQCNCR